MSVLAIPSSGFYTAQNIQSTFQQFQQLGRTCSLGIYPQRSRILPA
jgi:hypothetical protein